MNYDSSGDRTNDQLRLKNMSHAGFPGWLVLFALGCLCEAKPRASNVWRLLARCGNTIFAQKQPNLWLTPTPALNFTSHPPLQTAGLMGWLLPP